MKKLLFSAYSLDVGGIETALVTLLNELAKKQYEITLVLEKKQGIFLEDIDKKIKNEGLLLNVISDQGVKNGDIVKTTIEGDLP